jgi:hypothetical protein
MKAGRLLVNIGAATLSGCLLLLVTSSQAAKAIEAPQDVTFEGSIPDSAPTLTLSFTADLTGVTRARVEGWTITAVAPDGALVPFYFSGEVYFTPPRLVTNGAFDVNVPQNAHSLDGSGSWMRLEGNLESKSAVAGTATFCLWIYHAPCMPLSLHSPFTATKQPSPNPAERLIVGQLAGGSGRVILSTDADGENIDAVSLQDVSLPGCTSSSQAALRIHVDLPQPASSFRLSTRVFVPSRLLSIVIDGSVSHDGQAYGTLEGSDVFLPPCRDRFRFTWATAPRHHSFCLPRWPPHSSCWGHWGR